jgi:hypothetical protein
MSRSAYFLSVATLFLAGLAAPSRAEDSPAEAAAPAAPGVRRALIICGLPGDADRRKTFAETVELLHSGLTTKHGFAAESVVVLWSGETTDKDGPALSARRGEPTRETLTETAADLRKNLSPEDTLWVFVLGHCHYDGRHSWFNIPGPDINQLDFGKLFAGMRSREQAFFITTSASGFYLRPLAAPGRMVASATEPAQEVNETYFPHKLAKALADPPPFPELDMDEDGRPTLLDAYLWAAKATAEEFGPNMLLATEHSLLDDNGDGKGSEIQADFLPEELGGRRTARTVLPTFKAGDGALAKRIWLPHPPAPPAPDLSSEPAPVSPDTAPGTSATGLPASPLPKSPGSP